MNHINDATGYRVINTGLIPITESSLLTTSDLGACADNITITRIKHAAAAVAGGARAVSVTEYVRLIGEVGENFYQRIATKINTDYNKPVRNTPLRWARPMDLTALCRARNYEFSLHT